MKKVSGMVEFPMDIYLFKVNSRNTGITCEICSKLTARYENDVNDVAFLSLLQSLNRLTPSSSVSIVNFEPARMIIIRMTIVIMKLLTDLTSQ